MSRKIGEEVLGRTSGQTFNDKESWWWNEEVQQAIKAKKEAKKIADKTAMHKDREEYRKANKQAKNLNNFYISSQYPAYPPKLCQIGRAHV